MDNLTHVLAEKETVLFIGSGISRWSGIPSWPELIEELACFLERSGHKADLVRAELRDGDLLQAASYGFDKLTKQQVGHFIRTVCRFGVAKPHEIHRKIISLGPRCFITTNYDDLIEAALRKWQPNRCIRPPVTNRHLTETADIVHARAIDFIFKPHGDVADTDSIILTREQYRKLLPQGKRHAALESLKMLMVSRPVVYFGFGFRDLDFIYVRDILANIYKGGTRDHYAIMADISDEESDYWRRHYGIHIVGYKTTKVDHETRDHTPLLTFLDSLLENVPQSPPTVGFDPHRPDVVLALARHSASLSLSQRISPEFQIRVHSTTERQSSRSLTDKIDKFDHFPVQNFLDAGPERAVMIGLPGTGKTYALRQSAARLADKLNASCLCDPFDPKAVVVPIFADFKLYRGDLSELVSHALPRNLSFSDVIRSFNTKIFLDSFNEMPRKFWDSGSYESDIDNFMDEIGNSSIIISSRTSDGLDKLGLPIYSLDQIDVTDIEETLQRLDIDITPRFNREVWSLLQRPYYFRQIVSGAVKLPREARPLDFHRVFVNDLSTVFKSQFSAKCNMELLLARVAYEALNQGEEAFPLARFLHIVSTNIDAVSSNNAYALEIANWLVSSSVLIPYTGQRISFVHQSLTEYLAASELARRYQVNPQILKQNLEITRWDRALFLTLGLLPTPLTQVFLDDIIKADFALGLRATKYLEAGCEDVVSKLLSEIPGRLRVSRSLDQCIESALEFDLPLTEVHEPHLRTLIGLGGMIGAASVSRLVGMRGESVKDELLQMLVDRCDDYNFCCNGIASALKAFATKDDARSISQWAYSIARSPHDGDNHGFIYGAAEFLSGLDLSVIREALLPEETNESVSELHSRIVCCILRKHHSTAALEIAGELLCREVVEAATAIYFISNFASAEVRLSWDTFSPVHVRRLISILDTEHSWAVPALRCLCAARPDLSGVVRQEASDRSCIHRAVLIHCISPSELGPVFRALAELVDMDTDQRRQQPLQTLQHLECDWAGEDDLFVRLLRLRDLEVAEALVGCSVPPLISGLATLEIGPVCWWMEWMNEVMDGGEHWFLLHALGALFGRHLDREQQREFLREFNEPRSKFRHLLVRFVLPYFTEVTTDMFTEDAISFLLADLSFEASAGPSDLQLLGSTATEDFVTERLVPLLLNAKQPVSGNLDTVLRQAGSRHGRRYFVELLAGDSRQQE